MNEELGGQNKEIDGFFANMANEKNKQEFQEIYNNNRGNNHKVKISKKNLKTKKINIKKIMIAIAITLGVSSIGIGHMHAQEIIYSNAVENGIIPQEISFINDSQAPYVRFVNEFGERVTEHLDEFREDVIKKGEQKGYNIDEIAVALSPYHVHVENSSKLGRIGAELTALANEKRVQEGGRTK